MCQSLMQAQDLFFEFRIFTNWNIKHTCQVLPMISRVSFFGMGQKKLNTFAKQSKYYMVFSEIFQSYSEAFSTHT